MAAARFSSAAASAGRSSGPSTTPFGVNGSTSSATASSSTADMAQSKVASASTALDRVMGLLDGFEDDMDCPLCLEEMDISDLNFKPCPCGYQICRFCWHHIKENLNGRCPACRTPYDDTTVEFKAIKPDELKRLQAAKKLRDKRRKEEALTVKNLASVRVRQRAQVHIQGMTSKIANEDTLNQLKGPEQFGQYGKVVKLFMSKRQAPASASAAPTHPHHIPVNVYVNYRTPAEAALCISAMDGMTTADGHRLKAIWGTTRYCPTYLKGGKCNNENCMQAHEPGEEIEGAGPTSREEMYTYHAMSDSDMQQRSKTTTAAVQRKQQEAATLPPSASWASKNGPPLSVPVAVPIPVAIPKLQPQRAIPVSKPQTHPLPARPASRSTPPTSTPKTAEASLPTPPLPSSTIKASIAKVSKKAAPVSAPVASSSSSSSPPSPASLAAPLPRAPAPEDAFGVFPDLEFGEGTFSFSLDPDAKGKGRASPVPVLVLGVDDVPFERPEMDVLAPPGYLGSFDPFSDGSALDTGTDPHSGSSSPPPGGQEDMLRRGSRFGFARRESHGVPKMSHDLSSVFARNAFGGGGRESPAIPPGFGGVQQHRSPSSLGGGSSSNNDHMNDNLWGHATNGLPPGVLRSLASPNGSSATSSPQLSPRVRSSLPPPGLGGTPGGAGAGAGSGAGAGAANRPLAAAHLPLPPPAPKTGGQQAGTIVGKDDILALIAAASSKNKQQQASPAQNGHAQQALHHGQPQLDASNFFSDPAILSARLPGGTNHFQHQQQSQTPNGMVSPSAAFHSLDGGLPPHALPQGYRYPGPPSYATGPPPGVRPPPQLQAYQQYRS